MANRNSTSRFINLGPIYLRSLCENDLDGSWYHWFNDPEITRFQDKGFFPNNLRKQTKYYEKIVDSTEDVVLAMVDASDEVHFGNSGLHSINWIHRTATLGIVIGLKEYQGKGYGKLAWQGLTDYGFHVLGLEKINATIFEGNESSKKCAESAGFAIEGRLESQFYKAGTRHHALLYGLTREKWSVKP